MGYIVELDPELGPALVIGGGVVAARKIRGLAAAGFRVTVIAPTIDEVARAEPLVTAHARTFEPEDIEGHVLVFACTDAREVNEHVGRLARQAGIPVVVADRQDEGTASTPATYRSGRLSVAVSTGGGSPGMAAEIRDQIAAWLGPDIADRIEKAAAERDDRLGRA